MMIGNPQLPPRRFFLWGWSKAHPPPKTIWIHLGLQCIGSSGGETDFSSPRRPEIPPTHRHYGNRSRGNPNPCSSISIPTRKRTHPQRKKFCNSRIVYYKLGNGARPEEEHRAETQPPGPGEGGRTGRPQATHRFEGPKRKKGE